MLIHQQLQVARVRSLMIVLYVRLTERFKGLGRPLPLSENAAFHAGQLGRNFQLARLFADELSTRFFHRVSPLARDFNHVRKSDMQHAVNGGSLCRQRLRQSGS